MGINARRKQRTTDVSQRVENGLSHLEVCKKWSSAPVKRAIRPRGLWGSIRCAWCFDKAVDQLVCASGQIEGVFLNPFNTSIEPFPNLVSRISHFLLSSFFLFHVEIYPALLHIIFLITKKVLFDRYHVLGWSIDSGSMRLCACECVQVSCKNMEYVKLKSGAAIEVEI